MNSALKKLVEAGYLRLEAVNGNLKNKQVSITEAGDAYLHRTVDRVFSLEDGAWVHCTAGFAFDLAEGRFSVVTPGLADGATVNFTTPSGVLSSAGAPGFEPPDAGFYLYGALGRSVTAQTGQNIPVAVQVFGTYDPETDSGEVVSADPEGFYNPEIFEGMDGVYVLCLCFLSEENPPLAQ